MQRLGKVGATGAALIDRVKPVVRRGIAKVEPLDRIARQNNQNRRRTDRLAAMYETLRRSYNPGLKKLQPGDLPRVADIARVEASASKANDVYGAFFRILCFEGDFDRAAVTLTRRLIAAKEPGQARSIAQVMQEVLRYK